MNYGDVIGVAVVYGYVAFLLVLTEKVLAKRYPLQSRKLLHMLTGNIAFLLPVFVTREIMAFVAAGPFILFTFLMSPYSPIKSMRGKTSEAGHGLGLVYYAITWTILAYVFFDHRVIIAIGILAMSYGDGLASLIGVKYGKRKYTIFHDTKSYVGSMVMGIATFAMLLVAVGFYQFFGTPVVLSVMLLVKLVAIALVAMVVEAATPFGLDNLSVPFVAALLYWWWVIL
jgi:dolichol kinase